MSTLALVCGLVLVALGCVAIVAGPPPGVTTLLPAGIGAIFVILGTLARKPELKKHVMHAAAMLAVIGVLVSFPAAADLFRPAAGGPAGERMVGYTQTLMACVCAVFLVAAVRSFIVARRGR